MRLLCRGFVPVHHFLKCQSSKVHQFFNDNIDIINNNDNNNTSTTTTVTTTNNNNNNNNKTIANLEVINTLWFEYLQISTKLCVAYGALSGITI